MSIELSKRTDGAKISLVKKMTEAAEKGLDVDNLSARVVLVMDFSGSMDSRYRNGEVQDIAERTLALSLAGLDDDGDIQINFFDNLVYPEIEVDKDSYVGVVEKFYKTHRMGGTNYVPAIQQVIDSVAGKKGIFGRNRRLDVSKTTPTLVFFVTDGVPNDKSETLQLLKQSANLPIFWKFLGVGYSPAFLSELDTMAGRLVDNVGLTEMSKTTDLDDAAYFDAVLDEFVTSWVPAARREGIIS